MVLRAALPPMPPCQRADQCFVGPWLRRCPCVAAAGGDDYFAPASVVNEFGLQDAEPAFSRRIVPAIALPAHRRHDAVRFQQLPVVAGGVLTAATGVVDESATGPLSLNGHGQRRDRQLLPRCSGRPLGCNSATASRLNSSVDL